jgi:hypothetical protein
VSLDYCAHNLIRLTYRHPDCSRRSRLDGARVEPQKPRDPTEYYATSPSWSWTCGPFLAELQRLLQL